MELRTGGWIYSVGEDGINAFTDFGIENLIELIKFYKGNPQAVITAAYAERDTSKADFLG